MYRSNTWRTLFQPSLLVPLGSQLPEEKKAVKGARTPGKKASSAFGCLRSNGARLTCVGALVGAPRTGIKVYTMYLNLTDPKSPAEQNCITGAGKCPVWSAAPASGERVI